MCVFQVYDVFVVFEIYVPLLVFPGAVFALGPRSQMKYYRRWYVVDAADMALQVVDG